ncbi:MAG: hypothetical protein HYU62_00180 [Caulobacterales bacterium]|nr:hypothetical protein [Caulobacterales bacterium]
MTFSYRARDLLLGLFLIVTGILIGLTFNAAPSRAQNVGGQGGYLEVEGRWWYCTGRACAPVNLNLYG